MSLQPMQGKDAELLRAWDAAQRAKPQPELNAKYPVHFNIDWNRLAQAHNYYCGKGFKYIESPWMVDDQAVNIMAPPGAHWFKTEDGSLVASGEQSLFAIRDRLKPGKYQTITPCFRKEVPGNPLLQQSFIKLELMHVLDSKESWIQPFAELITTAEGAFKYVAPLPTPPSLFERRDTHEGVDIYLRGVEIGSYGMRQVDGFRWLYGTGLAEPRFSMAASGKFFPPGQKTGG